MSVLEQSGVGASAASRGVPMQLALDFGMPPDIPVRAPKTSRRHRLFFAALPTPIAAERIAAQANRLKCVHDLWGRQRPEELLHVTLNYIGSYSTLPAGKLAAAIYAGASVKMAPFEVTLDRAKSFWSYKPSLPFVLLCGSGTTELTTLRNVIGAAMRRVGLEYDRSDFIPHVTMLYDRQSVLERNINEPISWTVREFVLVHSVWGETRHIYRARWLLRG